MEKFYDWFRSIPQYAWSIGAFFLIGSIVHYFVNGHVASLFVGFLVTFLVFMSCSLRDYIRGHRND